MLSVHSNTPCVHVKNWRRVFSPLLCGNAPAVHNLTSLFFLVVVVIVVVVVVTVWFVVVIVVVCCCHSAPDKVENLLRHNVRTSSKLIGHTQELTGNKINNVLQSSTKGKCIVL